MCLQIKIMSDSARWHARLGHINTENMRSMFQRELVVGVPKINIEKELCGSCLLGKQTRQIFPQSTKYRATTVLELLHGDLCGPITPSTMSKNRYIFVLIDDCSRYMWTLLLKEKSETFSKFKRFKSLIELETGERIKTFRTDRGGEFVSQEFNSFCDNSGIKRHLTAPYMPQQNGVVERRNRTLLEMTRSMLKHMKLPNFLWGEAIRHATYLINRMATRSLKECTPYEALRHKKPNIEHIRVFGCISFARIETPHLKKLDDRSRMLVHLGTEPGSKAYRLYDPTNQKIVVSRDVKFDESQGWNWISGKNPENDIPGNFRVTIGVHGNHGIPHQDTVVNAQTGEDDNIGDNNRNNEEDYSDGEEKQSDDGEYQTPINNNGTGGNLENGAGGDVENRPQL